MKHIIFLFIILFFSGCFEKEDCPAYPADYLKWMPYRNGQTLSFTDGNNVFQLSVDQSEKSKKHKVYKDLRGLYHCSPHALAEISSPTTYPKISIWSSIGCVDCTTTSNLSPVIHFSFTITEKDNDQSHFMLAFKGERLFIDKEIFGDYYSAEILSSHYNGHKEYTKVVCIEHDTVYPPMDIYKLYLAESVGIIEYVRKKSNQSVYLIDY